MIIHKDVLKVINTDDLILKNKKHATVLKQVNQLFDDRKENIIRIVKSQQKSSNPKEAEKKLKELDKPRKNERRDLQLVELCENDPTLQKAIVAYKKTEKDYISVCNGSVSEQEKIDCRKKIVKKLLEMRQQIYKQDEQLNKEFNDETSILNKTELVQKFSDLFATKFNCDQLKDSDETEYFKCLVEKGMMFASILYAKQMAYDKDKDIEFLCDLLISETTEAKGLYTFYSRLQRCLAKIQIKFLQETIH